MTAGWLRLLPGLLVLASAACEPPRAQGPAPAPALRSAGTAAQLSAAAPFARLRLPPQAGRLVLEILDVNNPELHPVRIDVRIAGAAELHQSVSLYPPDRPARTFLRPVPAGTEAIEVTLVTAPGAALGGSIEVRLGVL